MAVLYPPTADVPVFEFRHRLALALEHGDVSINEMAAELGISRNTVGNYVAGRSKPTRAVLLVWAMRTGVSFEWLLTGDTAPGDNSPNTPPVTIRYPALLALAA